MKTPLSHWRKAAPFLIVASLIGVLTSCGGGGGEGGSSSTTPTATPNTGTTTTINNIAVPVIPDVTTNNATIAGVDSNKNGIRDDVDRLIAVTNTGTQQQNTATRISAAMKAQTALTAANQKANDYRKYECDITSLGPEDGVVFHNAIFNTKERRAMYKNNLPAAGTSYTLSVRPDGLGIQDSVCTSDVKPYKSNE